MRTLKHINIEIDDSMPDDEHIWCGTIFRNGLTSTIQVSVEIETGKWNPGGDLTRISIKANSDVINAFLDRVGHATV